MKRSTRIALAAFALALTAPLCAVESAGNDEAGQRNIPAPFAPFEYLVGRWTGQGAPKDNPAQKFRGWTETHTWAWTFAHGKPVGLTLTIEGGKVLVSGKLTYDAARKRYHLEGREPHPAAGTIAFDGTLDKTGKYLVLDHTEPRGKAGKPTGTLRLSIWPNANFIRYTMAHDLQEPGSVRFTRLIEVGLTRDGESLAGAATISQRRRCVVTGRAATMTMSYQGRTFPICCTGCRDEFNENPEKYIKKARLMLDSQAGKSKSGQPAPARVSRFEDAFANDVVELPGNAPPKPGASNETTAKARPNADSKRADSKLSTATTGTKKNDDRSAVARQATRAASLLKLGQNLEKAGNTTAALGYYRRVVKDFAKTPAAKTAASRLKSLENPQ